MSFVFLSYSNNDASMILELVKDLEAAGYGVWWDAKLTPGADYAHQLGKRIDDSAAVIVLWTENSIGSLFVWAEAHRGYVNGKLVQVVSSELLNNKLPLPFNAIHSVLLSDRNSIVGALDQMQVPSSRESSAARTPTLAELATGKTAPNYGWEELVGQLKEDVEDDIWLKHALEVAGVSHEQLEQMVESKRQKNFIDETGSVL